MPPPLFCKLDNLLLKVVDLDAALEFYSMKLGHPLLWRDADAAGLAMPETDAELVLHTKLGPETDIVVRDVSQAFHAFLDAGGRAIHEPFEIAIGKCAVVADPFGNVLTLLDQSKGVLSTNAAGRVTGVRPRDTADDAPSG